MKRKVVSVVYDRRKEVEAKGAGNVEIIDNKNGVFYEADGKPAFDGNGKTFSFAYAIIGGWLSAFMPTTEL